MSLHGTLKMSLHSTSNMILILKLLRRVASSAQPFRSRFQMEFPLLVGTSKTESFWKTEPNWYQFSHICYCRMLVLELVDIDGIQARLDLISCPSRYLKHDGLLSEFIIHFGTEQNPKCYGFKGRWSQIDCGFKFFDGRFDCYFFYHSQPLNPIEEFRGHLGGAHY